MHRPGSSSRAPAPPLAGRGERVPVPRRVLLASSFAVLLAAALAVAASAAAQAAGGGPGQRPFDHRQHQALSCSACHGAGGDHRTTRVRTVRDCASCHHDARRAGGCVDCHTAARLPPPGNVAVSLALAVRPAGLVRELPFSHERHGDVACVACHRTAVTRAPDRSCAACHAEHHRPEATCSACHAVPAAAAHPPRSHNSCAGAGCHAPGTGAAPAAGRNVCLTCHADQQRHEPGAACASCHFMFEPPATAATFTATGGAP
jgi:hypothetical protein